MQETAGTLTLRIDHTSAATDDTQVKVQPSATTVLIQGLIMAQFNALNLPKERKTRSYIQRKLRKMGR